MEVLNEPIDGLLVLKPTVHEDERGYFMESYHKKTAQSLGIANDFVQDNESRSSRGVLRGLHYQTGSYAQSKWIRVVLGGVWDVAVDLRKGSPSFGQYFGVELSEQNKLQMYVPRGFAHGFLVLSTPTIFCYKCDNYYKKSAEAGIRFDDPELAIPWPDIGAHFQVSEKDSILPKLRDAAPSKVTYGK